MYGASERDLTPAGDTWSELYAAHAGSTMPALVTHDGVVTFAELSTLAARIAGWLDEANGSSGLAGHRLRERMSRGSQIN